jgi:hypothetical protein
MCAKTEEKVGEVGMPLSTHQRTRYALQVRSKIRKAFPLLASEEDENGEETDGEDEGQNGQRGPPMPQRQIYSNKPMPRKMN